MSSNKSYDDIVFLEIAISNRSGGYKVKYDFEKNLITWFDSYMWNNNFMKHMNQDKTDIMRSELPKTKLLDWLYGYIDGNNDKYGSVTANPATWDITVGFEDGTKVHGTATQHFPHEWNALKLLVEKTTACSFKLH